MKIYKMIFYSFPTIGRNLCLDVLGKFVFLFVLASRFGFGIVLRNIIIYIFFFSIFFFFCKNMLCIFFCV